MGEGSWLTRISICTQPISVKIRSEIYKGNRGDFYPPMWGELVSSPRKVERHRQSYRGDPLILSEREKGSVGRRSQGTSSSGRTTGSTGGEGAKRGLVRG